MCCRLHTSFTLSYASKTSAAANAASRGSGTAKGLRTRSLTVGGWGVGVGVGVGASPLGPASTPARARRRRAIIDWYCMLRFWRSSGLVLMVGMIWREMWLIMGGDLER